jgi:hypothetical protein
MKVCSLWFLVIVSGEADGSVGLVNQRPAEVGDFPLLWPVAMSSWTIVPWG